MVLQKNVPIKGVIFSSAESLCDSQRLFYNQLFHHPSASSSSIFCSNATSSEVYRSIGFNFYVRHPGVGFYQIDGNYADSAIFAIFFRPIFKCSEVCWSIDFKFHVKHPGSLLMFWKWCWLSIFCIFCNFFFIVSAQFSNAISPEIPWPIDLKFLLAEHQGPWASCFRKLAPLRVYIF